MARNDDRNGARQVERGDTRTSGARRGASRPAKPDGRKKRPKATAARESRGIPAPYLLVALGLLVLVVSLPRFRAQVVLDNSAEAGATLLLVGELASARGQRDLTSLLTEEASLRRRLRDARPAAEGRVRFHGYLIDEVALEDGTPAIGAWPVDYGRTGRDAWLVLDDGSVYRHPNGGLWTGAARPLRRVALDRPWRLAEVTSVGR